MSIGGWVAGVWLGLMTVGAIGQEPEKFSRKNTWTVFTEYSNTSSHILLGQSRDRKWVTLGGSYARRLARSRVGDFSYVAELRPLVFESDPVATNDFTLVSSVPSNSFSGVFSDVTIASCVAGTFIFTGSTPATPSGPSETFTSTSRVTCSRRWSFAQEFSPIGLKQSFRQGNAVQPFLVWTAGYLYSSRQIPVPLAGSFNFEFDLGAGVEIFRTATRSVALEYRYHHFSNAGTAAQNPGVDNGVLKLSYSFGR